MLSFHCLSRVFSYDFLQSTHKSLTIPPQRKALDNIDLNLVSHRYVSGVLKDDHFVSARSLLIDRGEDYFSHRTVNRPFQFILLKSCSILNGFQQYFVTKYTADGCSEKSFCVAGLGRCCLLSTC